jgi:N-acetylglucosaminyldiphosphoundecaprenol N-acetyl-beta-D-mannosaminyltransferase
MTARAPGAAVRDRIFGLKISPWTAHEVAGRVLATLRPAEAGVGLVVTPNIQHIAVLRADPAFREAYENAEVTTCDGFPVYYYAKLRHCAAPGRVTGCDIVEAIMTELVIPDDRRLFFVVDQPRTETAVRAWAEARGMGERVATIIPPFGFEHDKAFCLDLAARIRAHGTTLLFMGVGAPKSEIFVHRHRDILPACWALCVGQGVKIALGLVPRAPRLVQAANLEWLWRTLQEPRRIGSRYAYSISGFVKAVIDDIRRKDGNSGRPVNSGSASTL